jgi:single-strand DNA-binding protein
MAALNKCMIIGNLTRDPEMRYTPPGVAVTKFSLAVNEKYKNDQGEEKGKVEFVNVVAWKRLAEVCGEFLKKGMPVYVCGKLTTTSYEKDGIKRFNTSITASEMQMLGSNQASSQDKVQGTPSADDGMYEDVRF